MKFKNYSLIKFVLIDLRIKTKNLGCDENDSVNLFYHYIYIESQTTDWNCSKTISHLKRLLSYQDLTIFSKVLEHDIYKYRAMLNCCFPTSITENTSKLYIIISWNKFK